MLPILHHQTNLEYTWGSKAQGAIALQRNTLACVSEKEGLQILLDWQDTSSNPLHFNSPQWQPSSLMFSPSGRFLLLKAADHKRISIFDRASREWKAEFVLQPPKIIVVAATLALMNGREVLVLSRQWQQLEVFYLEDMSQSLLLDCSKRVLFGVDFVFHDFVANTSNPEEVFVLGFQQGESKDTLVTISLSCLLSAQHPQKSMNRGTVHDYAYKLAVGNCGQGNVVVFRDPEEDEEPDQEPVPGEAISDVYGYKGFYVRDASSGKLVERIIYDAPIETATTLFGNSQVVCVVRPDILEIVSRSGRDDATTRIPGTAFGLDPSHGQAVVAASNGRLEVFVLPQV